MKKALSLLTPKFQSGPKKYGPLAHHSLTYTFLGQKLTPLCRDMSYLLSYPCDVSFMFPNQDWTFFFFFFFLIFFKNKFIYKIYKIIYFTELGQHLTNPIFKILQRAHAIY